MRNTHIRHPFIVKGCGFYLFFDKSKELYQIIQTRWNLQNQSFKPIDIEEDLLNVIEYQINKTEEPVSEYEIIEGLVNGYNPYTGEVFDENHILNHVLQFFLHFQYYYFLEEQYFP